MTTIVRLTLTVMFVVALLATASAGNCADGTPYVAQVGQHYFTLDDPVFDAAAPTITFSGEEHDASAAPIEYAPMLQRCIATLAECADGGGPWLDVMFGDWSVTNGDAQWSWAWGCRASKRFYVYRQGLIMRMRDHSIRTVAPTSASDMIRVRCYQI